ncbi:MAG TPA: hypothetical protein VNY52_07435 [Solirubrobacteraceae bacterium]|jgi:hypothetical protein|nr:hypothetical protein [Solirubrobacteraceae bacterium]
MPDPVADTAHRAAERLAVELGPELLAEVEAAVQARDAEHSPERYVIDPISLGSLIVATATLAWTVYADLRKRTPKPAPEVIERTVRVELSRTDKTNPEQRDRIVEVVVNETLRVAHGQD